MKKDIKCHGELWDVNEYNERLSRENDITEEVDRQIRKLKIDRDKKIDEVWKRKYG